VPVEGLSWDLSFENFVDTGNPEAPLMQAPRPGQPLFSILASFAPANDVRSNDVRSNISWDINNYLNLTYIAGKSDLSHTENSQDDAGIAIPTSPTTPGGGSVQDAQTVYSDFFSYSNELQLKSTGTHLIDWIVGLYAFREHNGIRFDINQRISPAAILISRRNCLSTPASAQDTIPVASRTAVLTTNLKR
jgi:iron complex outermembrane receptor protein